MKTLLVIGASSDFGMALIRSVSGKYDTIWAHYRTWNEGMEALQKEIGEKIRWVQADLSERSDTERMISEVRETGPEPDHIVHLPMPPIFTQRYQKTEWSSFELGWDTAVRSAVLVTQAFLPRMVRQKSGKIVFMLSFFVCVCPKYETAYISVKYALLGLMKSLAAEYRDRGITVNGVSPDMTETKFISGLPHLLVEQYSETRPMKRILRVEDVIPAFAFLLSDGANNINGENIVIC